MCQAIKVNGSPGRTVGVIYFAFSDFLCCKQPFFSMGVGGVTAVVEPLVLMPYYHVVSTAAGSRLYRR